MSSGTDRGVPAALVAVLGAALAAGSLVMPWFDFNDRGIAEFINTLTNDGSGTGVVAAHLPLDHIQAGVRAGIAEVRRDFTAHMQGYEVLSSALLAGYVLALVGAGWSAFGLLTGRRLPPAVLIGSGLLVGGLAGRTITSPPGSSELADLGINVDLMAATSGAQLALLGALLMVVAGGLSLMTSGAVSAPAQAASNAAYAAPAGGVFVPAGLPAAQAAPTPIFVPTQPAPQPAPVMPMEAPMHDHIPKPYTPGSAYGEDGPSALDRESRLVRPNDPYAPKSTAVPIAPSVSAARAAVQRPVHEPNAFNSPKGPFGTAPAAFGAGGNAAAGYAQEDGPGSLGVYGVPQTAPVAKQPGEPQARKGSVAPPGLG